MNSGISRSVPVHKCVFLGEDGFWNHSITLLSLFPASTECLFVLYDDRVSQCGRMSTLGFVFPAYILPPGEPKIANNWGKFFQVPSSFSP